jgi:hypothetical protein
MVRVACHKITHSRAHPPGVEQRDRAPQPDDRYRRVSPVMAHSVDRLLSEPTAGTQPCRREPLFIPHFCGWPWPAESPSGLMAKAACEAVAGVWREVSEFR